VQTSNKTKQSAEVKQSINHQERWMHKAHYLFWKVVYSSIIVTDFKVNVKIIQALSLSLFLNAFVSINYLT
jgi:hypothetical protein